MLNLTHVWGTTSPMCRGTRVREHLTHVSGNQGEGTKVSVCGVCPGQGFQGPGAGNQGVVVRNRRKPSETVGNRRRTVGEPSKSKQ